VRAYRDLQVLGEPGSGLAAQVDPDANQQTLQPFRAASMGTDQLGKAFSKDMPAAFGIGTTKSPDQQLEVDGSAVSGQIHEKPCVCAVPAAGDAAARRAWRARLGALGDRKSTRLN